MIDQNHKNGGHKPEHFGARCRESFRACAHHISIGAGTHWAFMISLGLILVWGLTGPLFHFSDTWQLVINTATTIITFLMVLLRALHGARTRLVALEPLTDEELDDLEKEFEKVRQKAAARKL
jgi:low affinity Fe/Cu permease